MLYRARRCHYSLVVPWYDQLGCLINKQVGHILSYLFINSPSLPLLNARIVRVLMLG